MHWSDKYIGTPYIPQTGDCAALAERVAREVFKLDVVLPASRATTYREQAKQIRELRDDYAERIDEPFDGCPVLFTGRGQTCHVGVMCWIQGQWWVLHATSSAGAAVLQKLTDMELHFKLEGYYRWK